MWEVSERAELIQGERDAGEHFVTAVPLSALGLPTQRKKKRNFGLALPEVFHSLPSSPLHPQTGVKTHRGSLHPRAAGGSFSTQSTKMLYRGVTAHFYL